MRTQTTTAYKFSELTEDAKDNAITNLRDINVNFNWWEFIYEDAKNVGIKISTFDIDQYCKIKFEISAYDTAKEIIEQHGETCETYKTAKQFIEDRDKLVEKYSDGKQTDRVTEENEYDFDNECDELEEEFIKSIAEDYRIILQNEYEDQTSKESIIETINANDYEFTENGELI